MTSSSTSFTASNPLPSPTSGPHSRFRIRNVRVSTTGRVPAAAASLYDVLGIEEGATCQEIKAAYRRRARLLHPDVTKNELPNDTSSSSGEFIKLNEAYRTLSDPDKRSFYDRSILWRRRKLSSPLTGGSGGGSYGYGSGRRWETDQCW